LALLRLPIRRTIGLTVSRSKGDLDLNDFIPLLVGSIALRNGEKFSEPPARILGGQVIHTDIMTHLATVVQQGSTL